MWAEDEDRITVNENGAAEWDQMIIALRRMYWIKGEW